MKEAKRQSAGRMGAGVSLSFFLLDLFMSLLLLLHPVCLLLPWGVTRSHQGVKENRPPFEERTPAESGPCALQSPAQSSRGARGLRRPGARGGRPSPGLSSCSDADSRPNSLRQQHLARLMFNANALLRQKSFQDGAEDTEIAALYRANRRAHERRGFSSCTIIVFSSVQI